MWTQFRLMSLVLSIILIITMSLSFIDLKFNTKVYSNEENCIVEVEDEL